MPSVLGHIHYFCKQAAGHRLWVCSGRNCCRKHSESQPNMRTSYYTMDNLQIKETLFTCWLFFQLSSQYICCAIAVLGSWEKTSYINKQDYFLSKRAFRKGALSASDGVQLFLPTSGPCRIILIPKVTESCSRKRCLKSYTLKHSIHHWTQSILVEGGSAKWENSDPIALFFSALLSLKEVSQLVPATGAQVSQSALPG